MQVRKDRSSDARKLGYMRSFLSELNRRGWSHEEKTSLLWSRISCALRMTPSWNDGGQVYAAYPLRFVARTRATDCAKPPARICRTNGKSSRLVACLWEEELGRRKEGEAMWPEWRLISDEMGGSVIASIKRSIAMNSRPFLSMKVKVRLPATQGGCFDNETNM